MKTILALGAVLTVFGGHAFASSAPRPIGTPRPVEALTGPAVAPVDVAPPAPVWLGDSDTADDEWHCVCSARCDGHAVAESERVCADDDAIAEAVSDAVTACAHDADAACTETAHCACTCTLTGHDC